MEIKFWMVWNPDKYAPTRRHFSRVSADDEADRLAHQHPGQQFFVLKAVGGSESKAPRVHKIKMKKLEFITDRIPF